VEEVVVWPVLDVWFEQFGRLGVNAHLVGDILFVDGGLEEWECRMNDWSWRIGYVCKASAASSHRRRRIGVRRVEARSAIRGRRSKKAVSLDLRASRIDRKRAWG
jgi:hypothetical protein